MKIRKNKIILGITILLTSLTFNVHAMENITLQLQWTHAFQFAGYYMAKEKGFFKEEGLDVKFLEAGPGIDPVAQVLAGKAQYGVGTSSLIINKSMGQPVVVLGVIFQSSPQILISRKSLFKHKLIDFKEKNISIEPDAKELGVFLKKEGFSVGQYKINSNNGDSLKKFINLDLDLISAYSTYEPYLLEKEKIDVQIYYPKNSGLDFYGDNLFTTESELRQNTRVAKAMLHATKKGWEYALSNKEESLKIVKEKYAKDLDIDLLKFELKEIEKLVNSDFIDIGYMKKERWDSIANYFEQSGLIKNNFKIDDFLFFENDKEQIKELRIYLLLAIVFVIVCLSMIYFINKLNMKLRNSNLELEYANKKLNYMATHDILTGLVNRILFSESVKSGILWSKRTNKKIALMFIDLDKFKPINDNYGHHIGDLILIEFAKRLSASVRETDVTGRIGGDEFVVLLNNLENIEDSIIVANKINEIVTKPYEIGELKIDLKVSIGISICTDHSITEIELSKKADAAMYRAKYGNGEKIVMYEEGMKID